MLALLSLVEPTDWNSFKLVVTNFLVNNKSTNYKNIVDDLLKNYESMSRYSNYVFLLYLMSYIKFTFLIIGFQQMNTSHWKLISFTVIFFPNHLCDEYGERFHQHIKVMECWYHGFWMQLWWKIIFDPIYENQQKRKKDRNLFPTFIK